MDFPGKNTGMGCHFLLQGGLPDPGIELVSSALAGGFFITEPPRKPIGHNQGHDFSLQKKKCKSLVSVKKSLSLEIKDMQT